MVLNFKKEKKKDELRRIKVVIMKIKENWLNKRWFWKKYKYRKYRGK